MRTQVRLAYPLDNYETFASRNVHAAALLRYRQRTTASRENDEEMSVRTVSVAAAMVGEVAILACLALPHPSASL